VGISTTNFMRIYAQGFNGSDVSSRAEYSPS
jgi:hypothetical protein